MNLYILNAVEDAARQRNRRNINRVRNHSRALTAPVISSFLSCFPVPWSLEPIGERLSWDTSEIDIRADACDARLDAIYE